MILLMLIFIIPLIYLQSLNSDTEEQKFEDLEYRTNLRKKLVVRVDELRKIHGQDYDGKDIEDLLDKIEWIDAYDHPIIWESEDYDEEDDDEFEDDF